LRSANAFISSSAGGQRHHRSLHPIAAINSGGGTDDTAAL